MHQVMRIGLFIWMGVTGLLAGSGNPTLVETLRRGDTAALRTEIQNGADVESADEYGNSLLMHAAVYGTAADMEFLLARGANPNASNKKGHTPLMRSIPSLAKIKLLVDHGAQINTKAADGGTLLMMAAHVRGAPELVKYLISKGVDLDNANARGLDAVMIAADQGAFDNLKILLDAGAKADIQTKNVVIPKRNGTVVDAAMADTTRKRFVGVTALMAAAHADCEPCVRLLLMHGANARVVSLNGLTALHRAAYQGNPATVKMLLKAGAQVNVVDDRGLTPLMMAVNSHTRNQEVVELLLARSADITAKDQMGKTVQDWAAIGANSRIMELVHSPAAPEATLNQPARNDKPIDSVREFARRSIGLLQRTGPAF